MEGRRRWARCAAVAALVGAAGLASGCVNFGSVNLLSQTEVIGDVRTDAVVCASGSLGCNNGFSGVPAVSGTGQVLLGVQVEDQVRLAPLASSIAFAESPSYAAELQRLSPAPTGSRWEGYISEPRDYVAGSGPQAFTVTILQRLQRGPDGGPFVGPLEDRIVVGGRGVGPSAPATRPVACGPSARALFADPAAGGAVIICEDTYSEHTRQVRDLGILTGASASAPQGGLATVPFTVRYAGAPTSQVTFRLSASSTLPGALFAVTPASIVPLPGVADTTARVAVGVPADARPGTYDVALTAVTGNQTRTSVGTLRVVAAPPGVSGAGRLAGRLRLTAILPRRLSARIARRKGIVVLVGATGGGLARVQLFQGKGKLPKASKRVRLRVPGPVRVVLKSSKLRKGPYRIVIRADGRAFVRRGTLVR